MDSRDLSDHLRDQITLLDLTPRQVLLADEFVGNINDDGYLAPSPEEIVLALNEVLGARGGSGRSRHRGPPASTPLDEGEEMLAIVQALDPPGVGARDLRECLHAPARGSRRSSRRCRTAWCRDCFDELISHRWSEISKRFGISAVRRAEGRRRDRQARSQARPALQPRRRQLHHSRSRRGQDRRRSITSS